MKKTLKIVLAIAASAIAIYIVSLIVFIRLNSEKLANANADSGIMSKQDWHVFERLVHRYSSKTKKPITEDDFSTIMSLLHKGSLRDGQDNINQAAHFGTIVSVIASVEMTDAQKGVVVAAMKNALKEPDTPQQMIKVFAFFTMESMKDDGLVKEAIPYVDSTNPQMRLIARKYLKTCGYKI